MIDTAMARLNEGTIVIYALSVLFYFIDFLQHNRKAGKMVFLVAFYCLDSANRVFYLFYVGDGAVSGIKCDGGALFLCLGACHAVTCTDKAFTC